ncbi:hypothetical protein T492DRAFT_838610 [Pavlovales sp. CCMP2436]|nr:hypothetical protein T492DRAFT_838610 [Pavlovales sp. CCMP2436]
MSSSHVSPSVPKVPLAEPLLPPNERPGEWGIDAYANEGAPGSVTRAYTAPGAIADAAFAVPGAIADAALAAPGGSSGEPLRVYAKRYHMLAIYSSLAFVNQAIWLSFAPTADETASRYGVPLLAITTLNTSAAALFVPGAWLCARALARLGLRRTVLLAATMQAAGALVRVGADGLVRDLGSKQAAFAVLAIGQALASLGAPVFLNLPPVLAENWFDAKGREGAMSVGTLSSLLGQTNITAQF